LGPGWKMSPCITLAPGSTTTLAEIEGPGAITHLWITVDFDDLAVAGAARVSGR